MHTWLAALPKGRGRSAAFEKHLWWSPGSPAKTIIKGLKEAGYNPLAKTQRFIVKGAYGTLRPGELERARLWVPPLPRP